MTAPFVGSAAPSLFDPEPARARASDPVASHLAAKKIKSRKEIHTAIRTVLAEAAGPLSQFQVADRVRSDVRWAWRNWSDQSIRTACSTAGIRCVDMCAQSRTGTACGRYELIGLP